MIPVFLGQKKSQPATKNSTVDGLQKSKFTQISPATSFETL